MIATSVALPQFLRHLFLSHLCTEREGALDDTVARKVRGDAQAALSGLLFDGMTIMAGGLGLCGIIENLIAGICDAGVMDLTVISKNCGLDDFSLGNLLAGGQIKTMISSYVGKNKVFAELYLSGTLELEFNPQVTLAERIRAGAPEFAPSAPGPAWEPRGTGQGSPRVRRRALCHGAGPHRRPLHCQGLQGRPGAQSVLPAHGPELSR